MLTKTLDANAQELDRVDSRFGALIEEADPTTTSEMLPDWERVAGLPDNCSGQLGDTLQARRSGLLSKLTLTGGQSAGYFNEVTRSMGFETTIEEFKPFRAGLSFAGDPLGDSQWAAAWTLRAPLDAPTYFSAGRSYAGESLVLYGDVDLECRIKSAAPAHTAVLFAYGPRYPGLLMLQDGTFLLSNSTTGIFLE